MLNGCLYAYLEFCGGHLGWQKMAFTSCLTKGCDQPTPHNGSDGQRAATVIGIQTDSGQLGGGLSLDKQDQSDRHAAISSPPRRRPRISRRRVAIAPDRTGLDCRDCRKSSIRNGFAEKPA